MTRSPGHGGPANLTHKLLGSHLLDGELVPGQDIRVDVDQVLVEDATGTMAGMQFELLGVDDVAVPLAVMYVDHNVLQIDDKNMQDHRYLRSFSERYGLRFSPPVTASRTTSTSSDSPGRESCCSAPIRTPPRPARWG